MSDPIRGDDVKPESVEWLWRDRIPKAMLTMIAGRPDQGKSMMATAIAAEMTKQGINVLYSSKERSFGLVEQPRFQAAGGVLKRIHYWRFSLPRDFDALAEQIEKKDIGFVVMDPVNAHFIGASMNSDKARETINPLVELAERTGCTFLFIEHALKRVPSGAEPLSAIKGGSSGLPAACSMGFLFGTSPYNAEQKVLACVKHNITDKRAALVFNVDTDVVEGVKDEVPSLLYDSELEVFDPLALLKRDVESAGRGGRPSDKREAASEWLTNYLAEHGPTLAKTIAEDAKGFQMTQRTLRRAAADMEIVKTGAGSSMVWDLPDSIKALLEDREPATLEDTEEPVSGEEISENPIDDEELAKWLEGMSND